MPTLLSSASPRVAARRAGALAERIRRADDRRARLAQAIQAATDVLSLRDCAAGVDAAVATDDLETAAAHVAKFRLIEGAARAGGPALEGELVTGLKPMVIGRGRRGSGGRGRGRGRGRA